MNFLKIENPPPVKEFKCGSVKIAYGNFIKYSEVDGLDYLKSILIESVRDDFFISVMDISGNLPPHIDNGILTTINFYVRTSNYRTQFYKIGIDSPAPYSQGDGRTFDSAHLVRDDSFIAKDGEAWILNVREPHSIESLTADIQPRTAIVLQTRKYNFDDVVGMIKTV